MGIFRLFLSLVDFSDACNKGFFHQMGLYKMFTFVISTVIIVVGMDAGVALRLVSTLREGSGSITDRRSDRRGCHYRRAVVLRLKMER